MDDGNSRWTFWKTWRFDRPRLRRMAFVGMLIGSVGILLVLFFHGQYKFGPITLSLRTFRNPSRLLLISFGLWYVLTDRAFLFLRQLGRLGMADWKSGSWIRRGLILLAATQVYFLADAWLDFPHHVIRMHALMDETRTKFSSHYEKGDRRNLEHFAIECCQEIPEDARVLFHGHIEGMIFAYEFYPRRVFMLPQEMGEISRTWHHQAWLKGMPDDPLEPFWSSQFQVRSVERDEFLRGRGITHEVWFSEDDVAACRWRTLK